MARIYQQLSRTIQAIKNCRAAGNNEWLDRHETTLDNIQRELPSGSGIDNGTKIVRDECTPDKIVLSCGFHHMDENGYYDGWTEHKIVIRPTFDGISVQVSGRNRNDIKSYLAETYDYALSAEYVSA